MSARPLPYSDLSSTTPTVFGLIVFWIYAASPGPCDASLPSARWNVFQPFLARFGFVAEGVIVGRPASLKSGSATFDSPENAGPTMATIALSSMACLANCGAWSALPWLSSFSSDTWQPAFLALKRSIASLTPCSMLMPRLAALPVSAPKKAILRPEHFTLPSPGIVSGSAAAPAAVVALLPPAAVVDADFLLLLPHAPATSASATAPTPRRTARVVIAI